MIKRLWERVKQTVGITPVVPKEESYQALRDFLSQPFIAPPTGSFQQGGGQTLTPQGFYHSNAPQPTPHPVAYTPAPEPSLTLPGRKRHLSPLWLLWCKSRFMVTEDTAWQMGAEKMMDFEFNPKMRGNVEILPRDLVNPTLVSIRYNDPGKVGA